MDDDDGEGSTKDSEAEERGVISNKELFES